MPGHIGETPVLPGIKPYNQTLANCSKTTSVVLYGSVNE